MSTKELVEVGTESEFEETDLKVVEVEGMELGIRKVEGEYYALLNRCPHQNGPAATGKIQKKVTAEVPETGERTEQRYECGTRVVRCPMHGWGFDVETGSHMGDDESAPSLPTFDTVLEDGTIYVDI